MQSTPRLRLELPTWRNFTVCGASAGAPETPPAGQESGSAAAGSGTGSAGADEEIKDPKAKILSLTEEKDRHWARAQEAERKLNERLAADAEAERKALSEAERTKKDLETAQGQSAKLIETNRRLSLHNAFLLENDVMWHNPAHALSLADLSAVETEDDGTIKNPDALKSAIKDLAKHNAYLVKTADAPPAGKAPPPSSGSAPQGTPPPTNGLDAETLKRKFPALRAH